MATLSLPSGWRRVDSSSHPGEYYYVGPNGSTWTHPVTGVAEFASSVVPSPPRAEAASTARGPLRTASASPRRPFAHTTIYRQDFKQLPSAEAIIDRLDRITQYNPSNAPHPKALPHVCNFQSTQRADYAAPVGVVPQPPAHQWTLPVPTGSLGETTTYRADFPVLDKAAPPRSRRPHTPPKPSKFVFTSTQRASYSARAAGAPEPAAGQSVASSPRREQKAPTAMKADMSSHVFNDASHLLPPQAPKLSSPRAPRHSQDLGSAQLFGFSPRAASLRPASSTYRSDYVPITDPPKNHRLAARDHVYLPWRAGQNLATADQFDTLYSRSYTDATQSNGGRVAELMRTCHDVDALAKSRAKAHQELSAEM